MERSNDYGFRIRSYASGCAGCCARLSWVCYAGIKDSRFRPPANIRNGYLDDIAVNL